MLFYMLKDLKTNEMIYLCLLRKKERLPQESRL